MSSLILVLLIPATIGLLLSPAGRLYVVTAAGFVVFTPGYAGMATKVVFVALLIVASAASLFHLRDSPTRPRGHLLAAAACYAVSLVIATIIVPEGGIEATLQNGMPYALLLLLLPIAIDAGTNTRMRSLEIGLVVAGVVSTLSFAVFWLDRRGVSNLEADQLFAASLLMPALLFTWALATIDDRSGSLPWRILAGACLMLVPLAFLLTGTRTAFVFLAAPAVLLIRSLITGRRSSVLQLLRIALIAAISVPILAWLAQQFIGRPDFLYRRLRSLQYAMAYGSLGDSSLQERGIAHQAALATLDGHWTFGRGLSTPNPIDTFDTALAPVMRVGVFGVIFLVLYIFTALRWAKNVASTNRNGDVAEGTIIGWSWIAVASIALISPLEDRLFPFAFAFCVALGVGAGRVPAVTSDDRPAPAPAESQT